MANSAIWRCTTGAGSEANNTGDRIEFNESPIPANGKQITQSEFNMEVAVVENERPKRDVNSHQDLGFDGLTINITGSIRNPAGNTVGLLVKKWLIEPKKVNAFPKGRFGLRIDDFPHYDLTPVSTRGYIIKSWSWIREGEWKGRAAFVATLVLGGEVGSAPYTW